MSRTAPRVVWTSKDGKLRIVAEVLSTTDGASRTQLHAEKMALDLVGNPSWRLAHDEAKSIFAHAVASVLDIPGKILS